MDVNALVEQIDLDRIIDKLDINAIMARVDLDALVARTEIGSIIAATGAGIASKAIDVARSQGVGLDFFVQRWTDRLLRRRGIAATGWSGGADPRAGTRGPMSRYVAPDRDVGLQGHYAGICTRFVGFLFDVLAIVFLYDVFVRVTEYLVTTLSGQPFKISDLPVASWLVLILWAIFYCAYPVAAGGRTFGMAVTGLRVVRPDGSAGERSRGPDPGPGPAPELLDAGRRVPSHPLPQGRAGPSGSDRRTAVVYGWDARAARLRFLARSGTDSD